ncbi:unnamed protein product [Rotaria sp. Silwood2]|nr:unnamed protein product [Rotaria sp. Silwood2]
MTSDPSTSSGSMKKSSQPETTASSKKASSDKGPEQRYFHIPLIHKWIVRQMQIYPNEKAVLLIAGVDDMNMCKLSLDETGLTSRVGAEILDSNSEQEWFKHGGREYLNSHFGQISSKFVVQLLQNYC